MSAYMLEQLCDMRKSFGTLTALAVEHMKQDVLAGDLLCLCPGMATTESALLRLHDCTEKCSFAERLEESQFSAT